MSVLLENIYEVPTGFQ